MQEYRRLAGVMIRILILTCAVGSNLMAVQNNANKPAQQNEKKGSKGPLYSSAIRNDSRGSFGEEVRHQLVTLPHYSVFDWLEADVTADGEVTLRGNVVRSTTKTDAEARVKELESVSRVNNRIEVLPQSPSDDQLRIALYSAPLFRYGIAVIPSIHIIVANGHVLLKGVVAKAADSQLATTAASQIPGVFEVKNELQVEESLAENN
jgi:hyperosmotically inducible protein